MIDVAYKIVAFLVTLGVLVVFHELGHYLVARWCGVKVLRFSVGFGRVLASRRVGPDNTEWALSAIPLGGYVKMADEREGDVASADLPRAFNRQSVAKRIAIVAAGPIANLLLAIVLFAITYMVGIPGQRAVLATPAPGTAAAIAGVRAHDTVVAVNGEAIQSWQDLRWHLARAQGQTALTLGVEPQQQRAGDAPLPRVLPLTGLAVQDWEGNLAAKLGLRADFGPPLVEEAVSGKPAQQAGIEAGDRIFTVDGTPVLSPGDVAAVTNARPQLPIVFGIERKGRLQDITVTPESAVQGNRVVGIAGLRLKVDPEAAQRLSVTVRYGPVDALVQGARKTYELSIFTLQMLGRMLVGEASVKNISGPLTMADFAGQSAQAGVLVFVGYLALISISLGVLNLLPVPLLDGGHLLYYFVEIVKGSPVSDRVFEVGQRIGMAMLAVLMALALFNDVSACSDHRSTRIADAIPIGSQQLLRAWRPAVLVAALTALLLAIPAFAFDPFTVRDIRVEGVQRTEAGTIFSYLPIKVGERIDDAKVAQAIKALYATGFFRDVRIEAQGDILVVTVQERPTITSLTFVGNKEFDTDTIKKALKDVGIAEARIFDRSALERAEQELKRQYITRGKYAAKVQTTVTPLERNRVAINFTIEEGDTANIARINIVGNNTFTEKQLRSEMTLTTPNWLSWYTKDDQYSKQKLGADLEALRSFYQNRGYLEFNVESTQVAISPDKEDVLITINITEGPQFKVSSVGIGGDLVVPESDIRKLIQVKAGDIYSRSLLQASAKDISERLGVEGYAFANINAVPEIDRANNTVGFTFYVDAGRRVYVRKINISGNAKTRDEIIRREFRQLESAWYDGTRIERSKVRVRRLGYFEEGGVNLETPPVAGTTDQVDVDISIVEKNTGNLLAGVGYSSTDGLVFNASVSQQNIFGSGNALAFAVNTSKSARTLSLVFTEPYWTVDGVSRTWELYDRTIDPSSLSVSQYGSTTIGGALSFGVPVSEIDTINFGGRIEHTSLTLFDNSPPVYYQFVKDFGYVTNAYILSSGWARDTRNDILYPTFGRLQSALVEVGLPFGDIAYYKLAYLNQSFWPVYGDLVLMLRADLGYGDGIGGKPFPFFKAFYGGGVTSVRGYEAGSLGPRDIYGNVLGGKRKIIGNAEMFYPVIKGDRSVRVSGFFDLGQIYVDGAEPQYENFRYSAGVGLAWNSPIGPLKFSYAIPLNSIEGDKIQKFQFQVGSVF